MKEIAAVLTAVIVVGGLFYLEASLWNECRSDHSFFYCLRVMGH